MYINLSTFSIQCLVCDEGFNGQVLLLFFIIQLFLLLETIITYPFLLSRYVLVAWILGVIILFNSTQLSTSQPPPHF